MHEELRKTGAGIIGQQVSGASVLLMTDLGSITGTHLVPVRPLGMIPESRVSPKHSQVRPSKTKKK